MPVKTTVGQATTQVTTALGLMALHSAYKTQYFKNRIDGRTMKWYEDFPIGVLICLPSSHSSFDRVTLIVEKWKTSGP